MKKKKKLNIKKVLIFLLVLYMVGSFFYYLLSMPIKNIYVENNDYFKDQEIIDLAGIRNYPSFIFTTNSKIKSKLLKNNLIKNVNIKRKINGTIIINIEEYKPLFYDTNIKKVILSSGKSTDLKLNAPILINTMPKDIYEKLIVSLNKVEQDVYLKISEIEYIPTETDLERFLIKTADKIYIYINIKKFEDINFYNELISSIEGKTGTWNLDYGNFFVSD